MKIKFLTLAVICLFSSVTLFAQFKVGVKAGADIHKLDGQSFKDKFSFGYHLGGFAEIGLGKKFAVQPEVYFSQTNIDTSSSFSDIYQFDSLSKVKLKYLNIPLLLNFKANNFITLQAGPQFSILMDPDNTLVENGHNAFKTGDFSMLGGLQFNISKLRIYGRYTVGLNNINDLDNQEKWKNQKIQVGVGLAL
ncbi:MAG TPA: porin family protein [Ferruginibacter sp.]|nr:porin family protein [Ferruginibacter sp.]HRE63862.1 porin family protein [Ferruginibacter sp.]